MRQLNNVFIALIIFLVGLFCFAGFIVRDVSPHEAHLALYTQYLLYHGWVPLAKPYDGVFFNNLSTIPSLAYLSVLAFGKFSAFTISLPSSIAAAITLAMTYLIGTTRSRVWGLMAVLFVLTTEVFFLASRSLSVAPFMAMLMSLMLYAVIEFELNSILLHVSLFVLFLAGFLFQGLLGVVLVFLAAAVYLIWRLQFKKTLYLFANMLIAAILGLLLLLFVASEQGGSSLVQQVLTAQFVNLLPHSRAAWFSTHWLCLLWYCASLPIAIAVVVLRWGNLLLPKAKWQIQLLRALISWSLLVIFLDVWWGWQSAAMLSMVPALGLIAAYLFSEEHAGVMTNHVRNVVLLLFSLAPFVGFVIVLSFFASHYFHHSASSPFYLHSFILLLLLCVLTIFVSRFKQQKQWTKAVVLMVLGSLSYLVVNIGVVEPALASQNKTQALANLYHQILNKKAGQTVFYQLGPNNEDRLFIVDLHLRQEPLFVKDPNKVPVMKNAYFVTTEAIYKKMPELLQQNTKILLHGQLNRTPSVVFVFDRQQPVSKVASPPRGAS